MKLLSFKNKIHKSVNTIFYIIILGIGFIIGLCFNKIDYSKLLSQFLMIDNVQAYEFIQQNVTINEEWIYNTLTENFEDFDINTHNKIHLVLSPKNNYVEITAFSEEYLNCILNYSTITDKGDYYLISANNIDGSINCGTYRKIKYNTKTVNVSLKQNISNFYGNSWTFYKQEHPSSNTFSILTNFDWLDITKTNKLDFSKYLIPPIELDPQVNTWNGYGYDFYTNQVGILDMRKDTYIVNSHTCPNDGEFLTGFDGQSKDVCSWSYYNDLSDFLVFYFNGRIYDSENVEWSDITFLQGHTYSLSFTLYGLVPQEQLYSIQFSHEGELTQEIYSSSFGKVLTDSLDSRTYLTFSITPTEDITFDHFFIKYFTNGSYAQTVGASRLWVYNDYTGLSDEEMQIIQTDKLLSQNQTLKDLINNPFINTEKTDSFWNNFKQDDFGLTQIATLPLTTIKKISNGTCTPLNINILGKTIQLPCGDTLFWNREDIKDFKVFWNMIFGGILCYGIAISIYKDIHKAQSPMNDKLEVIDL